MMSLNGITKGTEFESMMKNLMQGEANGVMMYYALAQLAREQGLEDVAEGFIAAANEEAVHAGFYAVLNGKYPSDFWGLVRTVQKAEANGEAQVKAIADKVRAAGFAERAPDDANTIPNYLTPPLYENTEYYFFTSDPAHFTLFKADGDQDRPNIVLA